MKAFLLLAIVVAAAIGNVAAVCTGRVGADRFVGDLTPTDHVLQFSGNGYVDMPAGQIGSAAMTFISQVYTSSVDAGCLFSFANGQDQATLIEARIANGGVSFKSGTVAAISTFANVVPMNQWNTIAVVVDNAARTATIYVNALAVASGPIGVIASTTRKPMIGACASAPRFFTGSMDNFMVIAEKRTPVELGFFGSQYFPIVPENNLVAYYDFNSWATNEAPAWEGTAAVPGNMDAVVQVVSGSPVRKLKSQVSNAGSATTDKQCGFTGGIQWDDQANAARAPFFGIQGGGYTESFSCNAGGAQRFAMMEKWHEALGLVEVSLFTSMDHRWRVSLGANGLEVLHQNWGGWERIGATTEFVEDDGITFQISTEAFKVQVANYGWARIYKSGDVLAYDFAISSTTCNNGVPSNRDYCLWSASEVTKYEWTGTPLPEPMGVDAVGAPGVGGNPTVLACPTVGHVYRPDLWCTYAEAYSDPFCCQYAQYRGRPVCFGSYPIDYCNAHPEDSACCPVDPAAFGSRPVCLETYPDIYCNTPVGLTNDACCTKNYHCRDLCFNSYPHLYCPCHTDQLRCCPWNPTVAMCVAQQAPSPPPPPPSPIVEPPFVPSNPCAPLSNGNAEAKAQYAAIVASCDNIWTSTDSSGRRQCLAVGCAIGGNVPPPPDCKTAQMLKSANPDYVIPAACNGCPNGCSFNGNCNPSTRVCTCGADWSGPDCSVPKKYPCWTVKTTAPVTPALSVQPIQLFYQPPSNTPLLTSSFNYYAVENFNAQFANRVPDSVTVVPTYTLADWTTRTKDYHMFITGGNQASNTAAGSASITISRTGQLLVSPKVGYEYNVISSGSNGGSAQCENQGRLGTSANSITCQMSWPVGGQATITLIGLNAGDFTVTIDTASQVLTAGNSRQSTRIVEVLRQVPTGNIHSISFHNENCQAPANCNKPDCESCTTANAGCGWCVELNTCVPGGRSGPAVGICNNWRYTFDSVTTRRLTQVPSFPTNPGTTDVFTTMSDTTELPIELSVVVSKDSVVPWDVVILGQVDATNRNSWVLATRNLQSELAQGWPNLMLGFGALTGVGSGYRFLLTGTNPRAYGTFDATLNSCNTDCQAPVGATSLNIRSALQTLGDPATNEFNYRIGFNTRRIAVVMATAAINPSDAASAVEIRKRLLSKGQIVPIFAVPANVAAGYNQLVADLGFGAVIDLDASWSESGMVRAVYKAIRRAAYQVSLTHTITDAQTIVDTAAFTARIKSMTINGLAADDRLGTEYRAKFYVPVKATASPVNAQLYVPGFAQATIENVLTDRPTFVGVQEKYDVLEAGPDGSIEPVVIQLPGQSFRNLYQVVAKVETVTIIGTATGGSWSKLFSGPKNGAPYYGAGDVFDPTGKVIPEGAIVFTPPTLATNGGLSAKGKTYGDAFATVTYKLYDYCTMSISSKTITINVVHVNHPPYAQAIPAHGNEYTPIVVTLDAADVDQNAIDYYIAGAPTIRDSSPASRADAGKIYQYSATFDPKADNSATEITAAGTKLNENRLIYVPPRFAHSFADPVLAPELLLIPCLSYYVKETDTEELYESAVVDVPITIDHVNNAPWVFNDPDHPTEISHEWKFGERFPSQAQGVDCWGGFQAPVCNWQEDFGEEFWWQTLHRQLFFGGYDVEKSPLDVEISGLDCYPGSSILAPLSSLTQSINVGAVIRAQNNDMLNPIIRFKPVAETYDLHFAPKPYYCKISYRVRDQDDAVSLNEGSVTINIEHVNKQPRVTENDVSFTAYEQTPFQFQIKVVDPEGDDFTMTLVECEFNRGSYIFCNDESCMTTTTVDCASGVEQVIPVTAGVEFPMGQFTSAKLGEISEGIEYNTLTFRFEDSESTFPVRNVKVIFNVIKLNTPPIVTLDGEISNQHLRSVEAGAVYTAKFGVDDADAEQGVLTARVSLDATLAAGAKLDMNSFPTYVVQVSETEVAFDADLISLQDVVKSINVIAPQQTEAGSASAVLTFSVNDNGNTGQCPSDTFLRTSACPLETRTSVVITWTKPSDSTAAMIGGSSAAAAFGAVGAIAAAVLFRRAQTKAADGYTPWDNEALDEGIVSNPLYQQSGNSGENPLYNQPEFNNPSAHNGL